MREEGIFRLAGNKDRMDEVREKINQGMCIAKKKKKKKKQTKQIKPTTLKALLHLRKKRMSTLLLA